MGTVLLAPLLLLAALAVLAVVVVGAGAAAQPLPAGCGGAGTATRLGEVTLDAEQVGNADVIVRTTAGRSLPAYAAVVAVAAADTESGLRDLPGGDRDSAGLFQIRTGLHGADVARDPVLSTRWFLDQLVQVPNWRTVALTSAAAAVERPDEAYRGRYTAAQPLATAVVAQLWPAARAAAAAGDLPTPASDRSNPDTPTALPLCPPGGPGAGSGIPTDSVPCSTGGVGTVVPGPGDVPIRVCAIGPWQVDTTIAGRVAALLAASTAAGLDLGGGSYRSTAEQVALRRAHCGPTDYDVYTRPASQCSLPTAPPGKSMHEWARALDITSAGVLIRDHSDPAWQWLNANAARYGLRNLPSEPWHWSTNGR